MRTWMTTMLRRMKVSRSVDGARGSALQASFAEYLNVLNVIHGVGDLDGGTS